MYGEEFQAIIIIVIIIIIKRVFRSRDSSWLERTPPPYNDCSVQFVPLGFTLGDPTQLLQVGPCL